MSKRYLQKQRIRKIIREACGPSHMEAPCPIKTAQKLRDAGHSGEDLMQWVSQLISNFQGGQAPQMAMITHEAQPQTMVAMEHQASAGKTINSMTKARNRGGIVGGIGFKK